MWAAWGGGGGGGKGGCRVHCVHSESALMQGFRSGRAWWAMLSAARAAVPQILPASGSAAAIPAAGTAAAAAALRKPGHGRHHGHGHVATSRSSARVDSGGNIGRGAVAAAGPG